MNDGDKGQHGLIRAGLPDRRLLFLPNDRMGANADAVELWRLPTVPYGEIHWGKSMARRWQLPQVVWSVGGHGDPRDVA